MSKSEVPDNSITETKFSLVETESQAIDLDIIEHNRASKYFTSDLHEKKLEKNKSFFQIYSSRYKSFLSAPQVHFAYETFFNFIFLCLFSYVLLSEMVYIDDSSKRISIYEYITIYWVFSFLFEEMYQVNYKINKMLVLSLSKI